ncbi:hypothetical protein RUND412_008166 [Rhizina undulata]
MQQFREHDLRGKVLRIADLGLTGPDSTAKTGYYSGESKTARSSRQLRKAAAHEAIAGTCECTVSMFATSFLGA